MRIKNRRNWLITFAVFAALLNVCFWGYVFRDAWNPPVHNARCPSCWQTFHTEGLETMDIDDMRWAYDECPHCGHKDSVLNFATAWGGRKK